MKTLLYTLIVPLLSFALPSVALAAGYVPLEPLPFLSSTGYGTNLPALLQALFQLLIIGGAGVATLMITIGGIQYMFSDVMHQKAEGRARIQNSVFGLLLLLAIYLILRTVNPQLLNFDLSQITPVGQKSDQMVQQAKATQAQTQAAAASPGPASPTYSGGGNTSGGTSGGSTYTPGTTLPGDYGDGGGFGGYTPSSQGETTLPGDYGDGGGFSGYIPPAGVGADGYPLSEPAPSLTTRELQGPSTVGVTPSTGSGTASLNMSTPQNEQLSFYRPGNCMTLRNQLVGSPLTFVSCK